MIQATIIADSLNEHGHRLTTFVLTFPRIILAEFNTHRMISKNSASSRAIPFAKMLNMVETNPFIPIAFMKEHKGMQGTDYFEGLSADELQIEWLAARDAAVKSAKTLSDKGLTKQICNRILEPFMWHKVIATASDLQNFFALRAHEAAEIHIQKLAYTMLDVYNNSIPKQLIAGEWHVPYGDNMDMEQINKFIEKDSGENPNNLFNFNEFQMEYKVKIATARCARVSYTVVGEEDKPDNYENDIKLHDRLIASGHMSPAEHCAMAMTEDELDQYKHYTPRIDNDGKPMFWHVQSDYGVCGNFHGFKQYRKMLGEQENKKDSRVKQIENQKK